MGILEEIWEGADRYQDATLKRRDYIESLLKDERIIKILDVDALRLSEF